MKLTSSDVHYKTADMLANIITGIRVLCSIALLFCTALGPAFKTLYIIAGLTDMIDGWVARRMNTVSQFGAKFDSIADIIFVTVCLVKLIPILTFPYWLFIWIGVIACIKIFNIVYGFVVHRRFVSIHNRMNKVTGFLLFLFPLTWSMIDMQFSAVMVCFVATVAAIQEGLAISALPIQKNAVKNIP